MLVQSCLALNPPTAALAAPAPKLEKVIVLSPVPLTFVKVPLLVGLPVAVVFKLVAAAMVETTVKDRPLFVYTAPAVALAAKTVKLSEPSQFHPELVVGLKTAVAPLLYRSWLQINPVLGSCLSSPVTVGLGAVQVRLQLVVGVTGTP